MNDGLTSSDTPEPGTRTARERNSVLNQDDDDDHDDTVPWYEKAMLAKLISIDGDHPIVLTKDVTVVGRKRGVCDVYIDRSSVSKLHCVIVKTDGLLFIRDLGSTNGTKVNGQRVTRGALLPGDELAFANARFRVYLGPDEPESAGGGRPDRTEVMSSFPDVGDSFDDEAIAGHNSDL